MSKKNTGKGYEGLGAKVASIFADPETTVELDVDVDGIDCDRQFDVVVSRKINPCGMIRIGIEARDWGTKLNLTHLDAFAGKLPDCPSITKGMMINRKGYSGNAIKKAKRLGIELFRLEDREEHILETAFDLPIIVKEQRIRGVGIEGEFFNPGTFTIEKHEFKFNGLSYMKICLEAMRSYDGKFEGVVILKIPVSEFAIDGNEQVIKNMSMFVEVHTNFYFGTVNELPGSIILKDEIGDENRAVINASKISHLAYEKWPRFQKQEECPAHVGMLVHGFMSAKLQNDFIRDFASQYT